MTDIAAIPMRTIGPVKIIGAEINEEVLVPLATYESTLWPSTNRGAKVSRQAGGIEVTIIDERMTRSIALQAKNAASALKMVQQIVNTKAKLASIVTTISRFTRLLTIHHHIVANIIYLRLEFSTADAAGHNMVTLAAQHIQDYILQYHPQLRYISISANYCVDKKASAVNAILGRGKYVIAELIIPDTICHTTLKTTPQDIVNLNIKKNLIGNIIAGSLHTANAHYANLLLATYLATGQDAANIVEGSQGITHVEMRGNDLYFAVTLPNIIVGTVGHGKRLDFVERNLTLLDCIKPRQTGVNARRLAIIIAATVLCGELSLLAALTCQGELMRAHQLFERQGHKI